MNYFPRTFVTELEGIERTRQGRTEQFGVVSKEGLRLLYTVVYVFILLLFKIWN